MNQCFICIIDLLGTKGIWTEDNVEKYFEVITEVNKTLEAGKLHFQDKAKDQPLEFDFTSFSDTLVITLINQKRDNYFFEQYIESFSQIILGIFQSYFGHYFFARGAISFGDIEKRGRHFVGPAVDDAAEYFELQDMIGICLTPKTTLATEYAIEWNLKGLNKTIDKFIVKYKTPLKNKLELNLFQINWVKEFLEPQVDQLPLTPIARLSMFLSKRNIPTVAVSKFTNTISFFNYVIEKENNNIK